MNSLITISAFAGVAAGAKINGVLTKETLPSTGRNWVTLDNGVEFQPSKELDPNLKYVRKLWRSKHDKFQEDSFSKMFVDGTETYYDQYSQAWRVLGFFIDCDACDDDKGGAGCVNNNNNNNGCLRYLLWAAVRLYSNPQEGSCRSKKRNRTMTNKKSLSSFADTLSHSMLTLAIPAVGSVNISIMIEKPTCGMTTLANSTMEDDVYGWTAMIRIRNGACSDSSKSPIIMNGWNSYSSTRATAFGQMRSISLCKKIVSNGLHRAQLQIPP